MKALHQITQKHLLALVIAFSSIITAVDAAEVHVYRNQYGQLLFSDEKLNRPGYTYIRTLGGLAYAPRSAVSNDYGSSEGGKFKNQNKYNHYIQQAAHRFQIDPALVKAVIHAESAFNRKAESHVGAQGLMQLMPATAASYNVTDPFNPRQNIIAGTKHLKYLMDLFHDNIDHALAAYNAGQGNVYKYRGIPPFKETQDYVVKVKKLRGKYQNSF